MATILFNEIFSEDRMDRAYKKVSRGSHKFKNESLVFARNEVSNLKRLRSTLFDGSYKFSGYKQFKIYEPKERVINAPHFEDKIVQTCLVEKLSQIFIPKFITDSYACIADRGTHAAVDKVQTTLIAAKSKWGDDGYILKLDVSKFFYSIDREVVKRIYRKTIKEIDVLNVLDKIIDSGETISDKGLPLGNSLSQLMANIYMNKLDQICKRYWGYKFYVRYADDVIIILPNKKAAQIAKTNCTTYLKQHLKLNINKNKTQVFPLKHGVNAFGYKIHTTHKLLRNDSKKRIKRKIKKMPDLILSGRMSVAKADQMLASWSGHANHCDSHNFKKLILTNRQYITMTKKGILKIDRDTLSN